MWLCAVGGPAGLAVSLDRENGCRAMVRPRLVKTLPPRGRVRVLAGLKPRGLVGLTQQQLALVKNLRASIWRC